MKFYGKCGAIAETDSEDDDSTLMGVVAYCGKCKFRHEFDKESPGKKFSRLIRENNAQRADNDNYVNNREEQ